MPLDDDVKLEEYKHLNEEISNLVKDTRALEIYVAGAVMAYYAWVLSHCVSDTWLIWVPPALAVFFGAWRSLANFNRMLEISDFLQQTYKAAGWEKTLTKIRSSQKYKLVSFKKGSSGGLWVILLVFSVGVPAYLHSPNAFNKQACSHGDAGMNFIPQFGADEKSLAGSHAAEM
jgi:hypothetical protein